MSLISIVKKERLANRGQVQSLRRSHNQGVCMRSTMSGGNALYKVHQDLKIPILKRRTDI
jgi:hypothetical protein